MATTQSSVALAKPQSIWARKVKIDLKPLFKALAKAATHAATLKFEELGNDAVEAATSLGIETPVHELAYVLLKRAILDALLSLTRESNSHINPDLCQIDALSERTESLLESISVSFGRDFFQSPGKIPFVKTVSEAYAQWLCDAGVAPNAALSIASRLPQYFTFSLANEWRANAGRYKILLEQNGTPFSAAEAAQHGWQLYFSFLRKRVSESVFDEPFGLSQIYVPLNAYYLEPKERCSDSTSMLKSPQKRVCVRLDAELKRWMGAKNKADALRVISGGPGSGKSSFTKMFCCELAESGHAKPIYIPLHLIDPTRDVAQEVERFVRDEGLLGFNPLDPDRAEDDLLLVFDGLDELASMGKVAAQVARDFVQAVERMLERRNLGPHPIYILLSGRELIVQENETEFRRPKQILSILPYLVTDENELYKDPKKLLEIDLRQQWWKNYGELIGATFQALPKELQIREIDEITAQPLLNYLVALSYRRGKLEFSKSLNLNSVYGDLVAAVHERAYEKTRTYRPISHLKLNEFARVLEEIGLAAWHGSDGRSTSVREIMLHCQQSGLESLLKSFTEGAQAGVTKLLAAFFFRRSGENVGDDAAFVFTHKSFGEYLTATRIVRGLERVVTERARRNKNTDDGFDISDALVYWIKLAGPAPMTEYLQTFLQREIAQRTDIDLSEWQSILSELMAAAINRLLPIERIGNLSYATCVRYETNASTALLIALNACSLALRRVAKLQFATETSLGTFLRRVCPQRSGPKSPLLYSALSFMDFSGQCLDMFDFYGANLDHTIWKGSKVHFATFGRASISDADFSKAILTWSRFDDASIKNSNFDGANLTSTAWPGAMLDASSFQECDFRSADFGGTFIKLCHFNMATLSESTLNECSEFIASSINGAIICADDENLIRWRSEDKHNVQGSFDIRQEHEIRSPHSRRRRNKA
ncbi:pentapeptide repeat-containing protein [Paracidovorax avenae ATCC 19860]|uniref:Pentapeptide repeat-containing protein n=1 Tax=Paracidovorax avenae (strain ATCC 19860 / DSM 7227 / CCUG 15838 / JCM 20985 / LMG 2117 / NCPPB 1011) TaxID=643561 RepID=F0Q2R8_PARA1|nr:pentapeptide repeat-containing protein [Paracidovorax avenae]ADX44177.1 pentapeptide repeat-containing protein [Paracidovorax avenae ATCC 19860]